MDHSTLDIAGDLRQRGRRSQALTRVVEPALAPALFRRALRAVRRLGVSRLRDSYWTTFWLPASAAPAQVVEEAILALAKLAAPRGCRGMEWWIGRSYTTHVPVGFHF